MYTISQSKQHSVSICDCNQIFCSWSITLEAVLIQEKLAITGHCIALEMFDMKKAKYLPDNQINLSQRFTNTTFIFTMQT